MCWNEYIFCWSRQVLQNHASCNVTTYYRNLWVSVLVRVGRAWSPWQHFRSSHIISYEMMWLWHQHNQSQALYVWSCLKSSVCTCRRRCHKRRGKTCERCQHVTSPKVFAVFLMIFPANLVCKCSPCSHAQQAIFFAATVGCLQTWLACWFVFQLSSHHQSMVVWKYFQHGHTCMRHCLAWSCLSSTQLHC